MKQFILLLSLLFCAEIIAQNQLIGIRYTSLSSQEQSQQIYYETENYEVLNSQVLDFDLIFGHKMTKRDLLWVARIGLIENQITVEKLEEINRDFQGQTLLNQTENRHIRNYKLSLGLEKIHNFNKLQINTGFELPFKYSPKYSNTIVADYFTDYEAFFTSNEITTTNEISDFFSLGLNLIGRVYYQMNRWSIGVDFAVGVEYQRLRTENSTETFFSAQGQVSGQQYLYTSSNFKEDLFRDFQNVSVGLQYHFNLKNPNKKEKNKDKNKDKNKGTEEE